MDGFVAQTHARNYPLPPQARTHTTTCISHVCTLPGTETRQAGHPHAFVVLATHHMCIDSSRPRPVKHPSHTQVTPRKQEAVPDLVTASTGKQFPGPNGVAAVTPHTHVLHLGLCSCPGPVYCCSCPTPSPPAGPAVLPRLPCPMTPEPPDTGPGAGAELLPVGPTPCSCRCTRACCAAHTAFATYCMLAVYGHLRRGRAVRGRVRQQWHAWVVC